MSATRVGERVLQLVSDLCAALDAAGIEYCHWKSTDALDRSASGENDLDLLVAEGDTARFVTALRELGCIEAVESRTQRVPGVRHFYGFDRASLRLVDIHAHDRLALGDDATKNYRLPIEAAYLATTSPDGPFQVPAPAMELAIFVVRMMLKHGSPEAIVTGRGRLSRKEAAELGSLSARSGPGWEASLAAAAPRLDRELIARCASSLEPRPALRERLEAWRGLRRALAPYARRSRATDVWLQVTRRLLGRSRRALGWPRRKHPADGGSVIAVVGSDGSGKSTVIAGLDALLSPVFATMRIHLGKPRRSASWLAVRAWLHLARRLGLEAATPAQPIGSSQGSASGPPSRSRLLIDALTARDRRRAGLRAHRCAQRGAIVLSDRYPVPELSVDRPRSSHSTSGFAASLARAERRQHERIPPPDLIVVLALPPEVARARRPEADPGVIGARAREVLDAPWGTEVAVIDAARSREEVLAAVAARVWASL